LVGVRMMKWYSTWPLTFWSLQNLEWGSHDFLCFLCPDGFFLSCPSSLTHSSECSPQVIMFDEWYLELRFPLLGVPFLSCPSIVTLQNSGHWSPSVQCCPTPDLSKLCAFKGVLQSLTCLLPFGCSLWLAKSYMVCGPYTFIESMCEAGNIIISLGLMPFRLS
jgi:hypothetical protein